jgi:hypothetical protein
MNKIALEYISYGLSAVPANVLKKHPDIEWEEFQKRLPTLQNTNCWIYNNICIICGKVSGNLLMIDFDQQGKAFPKWKELIGTNILNRLVIETSQSGGLHAVVRSEAAVPGNQRLAVDTERKVLIETRGEGGLFLCAPSKGYKLIQGSFDKIPIFPESDIEILLQAAKYLNEYKPQPKPEQKPFTPSFHAGSNPCTAYNEHGIDHFRNELQKFGWTYYRTTSEYEEWSRPGRNNKSATICLEAPVFRTWSTNAVPFEHEKDYSLYDAYALLSHNGNDSEAVKQLVADGFGNNETVELPDFILGNNKKKIIPKQ